MLNKKMTKEENNSLNWLDSSKVLRHKMERF